MNDQVARISGIEVRETIPDWVVQQAEQVIMVDLTPRALLNRLIRGVVYSPDKAQKYLYICDIKNNTIWFLNREDGKIAGRLGSMGESGGQFFGLHMIATDSKGLIYTGEVFAGERVQRFVPADSPRGKILDQLSRVAP